MRIAVVGPGAVGSLFAGKLSGNPENEVFLVGHTGGKRSAHLEAIERNGLSVSGETEALFTGIKTSVNPLEVGPADLIVLTTKTYSTRKAAQAAKPLLSDNTIFLILQNGLGQEKDVFEFVPRRQVLRAITMNGVLPIAPGRIMHAGRGETVIGSLAEGQEKMLAKVKGVFDEAGLPTRISSDIRSDVWLKTLVNAGINAVGALYGKRNGEILEGEETARLCEAAVREGARVARALGVRLPGDPVAKTRAVAEATYQNKNSMWVDLSAGRRTEIDAINGFIVNEGRRLGIPTPVNCELTQRIKELEAQSLKPGLNKR